MHNIAPSRSIARRTRQLFLFAFIAASVGVFITAVGIFLYLVPFAAPTTTAAGVQRVLSVMLLIVGGLGLLAGFGLLVRALTRRVENDLALTTGQYLADYFDERYHFIRNINHPQLGYIDAVLVGPPGVLVFRILEADGQWLNEKGGWARKNSQGDWAPPRVNPTKEAIVDVKAVRSFLEKYKLPKLDVFGVVVFITEPPTLTVRLEEPVMPTAHLSGVIAALEDNYLARERLEAPEIERVVRRLLMLEDA